MQRKLFIVYSVLLWIGLILMWTYLEIPIPAVIIFNVVTFWGLHWSARFWRVLRVKLAKCRHGIRGGFGACESCSAADEQEIKVGPLGIVETQIDDDVVIAFDLAEKDSVKIIADKVNEALIVAGQAWGLSLKNNCHIYIVKSLWKYLFLFIPWQMSFLWVFVLPWWYLWSWKLWKRSGGWTQYYKEKTVIAIKAPSLWERSDFRIGALIFCEEKNMQVKIENTVCHELVHACAAGLKLPMWLNEGLAMVAVDIFSGKQTVRSDTVDYLRGNLPPASYEDLPSLDIETTAYQYIRGYWLVRCLEAKLPGFIKTEILSQPLDKKVLEQKIANALGLNHDSLWGDIDGLLTRQSAISNNEDQLSM